MRQFYITPEKWQTLSDKLSCNHYWKIIWFEKEHIGQIQIYMNYINSNIKGINHNKTIGIIIWCKENKYIIKYCSDNRIIARKYELV